jgi:hypothetical protein
MTEFGPRAHEAGGGSAAHVVWLCRTLAVCNAERRFFRRDGAAAEAEAAFLQLDAVSEAVEDDDMAKLKEGPAV